MARSRAALARERARAAKAKVDARRAERDAQIEAQQTAWFVALEDRSAALEKVDEAEQTMGRAVTQLLDIGLGVGEVAELCDTTPAEVRAMKKATAKTSKTDSPDASEALGQQHPDATPDGMSA